MEWLGENREKFRDECSTAEDNNLYRAQGKVFVVDELVKNFDKAPEVLVKFKNQER